MDLGALGGMMASAFGSTRNDIAGVAEDGTVDPDTRFSIQRGGALA